MADRDLLNANDRSDDLEGQRGADGGVGPERMRKASMAMLFHLPQPGQATELTVKPPSGFTSLRPIIYR